MINASKQHLAQNQISYVQHLKFAFWAGGLLLWAGFTSIIHSLIPALFPGVAARTVLRLYRIRIQHHPNPAYRELDQHD